MQAFIAGYCEISLIKSVSERRNYFEPGTDEYYNRKANTSSANTIGNDTGRTSRGIECYPAIWRVVQQIVGGYYEEILFFVFDNLWLDGFLPSGLSSAAEIKSC